jgi:PAS domain S-box-containing protein
MRNTTLPERFYALIFLLSLTLVSLSVYKLRAAHRSAEDAWNIRAEISEALSLHQKTDEALTISARMAAETGDTNWERRYREQEKDLIKAIGQFTSVSAKTESSKQMSEVDAATFGIMELENRAFSYVRAGQIDKAKETLNSRDYDQKKKAHNESIDKLSIHTTEQIDRMKERHNSNFSLWLAVTIIGLVLLLFSFLKSVRGFRGFAEELAEEREKIYRKRSDLELELEETNARLSQQEGVNRNFIKEQERLKSLFDDAPIAYHEVDEKGVIIAVNRTEQQMLGYTESEMVGQSVDQFIEVEETERVDEEFDSSRPFTQYEQYLKTKDGSRIPVLVQDRIFRESDGTLKSLRSAFLDITGRKQLDEGLRQKSQYFNLFETILQGIEHSASPNEALEVTLESICNHIKWPLAHAYLPVNDELVSASLWYVYGDSSHYSSFIQATESQRISSEEGLAGSVLMTQKSAWIIDLAFDFSCPRAQVAEESGLKTSFAFPVLCDERLMAVVEFFSLEPKELDGDLLEFSEKLGTILGKYIERKFALDSLGSKIPLLKVSGDRHYIIYCSPGAEDLFGYRSEEILGKPFADLCSSDEVHHINETFNLLAVDSNDTRVDMTSRHQSGKEIKLELELIPLGINQERSFEILVISKEQSSSHNGPDEDLFSTVDLIKADTRYLKDSCREMGRFLKSYNDLLKDHSKGKETGQHITQAIEMIKGVDLKHMSKEIPRVAKQAHQNITSLESRLRNGSNGHR